MPFQDEETTLPKLFYSKFPEDIDQRYVLLLDPMLATGGSAMKAVEVLMEHGVPEDRIIFINLVRSTSVRRFITDRSIIWLDLIPRRIEKFLRKISRVACDHRMD